MPITTFQNILSTDKLQSGFRAKFNANVALLITDITDNGDGTLTVTLQGGTNFIVDLGTSFYTKDEVVSLISSVSTVAWGSITGDVTDQSDVVGNLGVIDNIDDLTFSVNFAVESGDSDNPFGAFPASGYASFSEAGTTGWQLLVKEAVDTEIKFRLYYGGIWYPWVNIGVSGGAVITKTRTISDADTYTLSAPELAILNSYTRYPNFVAITTGSGQQWFDIYPIYTGTVGAFLSCVVQLHSDGSGGNADETVIQFS